MNECEAKKKNMSRQGLIQEYKLKCDKYCHSPWGKILRIFVSTTYMQVESFIEYSFKGIYP